MVATEPPGTSPGRRSLGSLALALVVHFVAVCLALRGALGPGLRDRRPPPAGEEKVMARKSKPPAGKRVETLRHGEAKRRNIPTAEYQSVIQREAEQPLRVAYERRNRDLDPQLV